jgi:hypothetical protein
VAVAVGMVLMKVVPWVPGHFSSYEWAALAAWAVVGWVLRRRPAAVQAASGHEG